MRLSVHAELVPAHIDGFVVETDFRISRFSAVGMAQATPTRAQHSRSELELVLVTRGQAQALGEDRRLTLEANDLAFIRPHQNRLIVSASSDFRAWDLVFRPRLLRRVCTTRASAPLRARGASELLKTRLPRAEVSALAALFATLPVGAGRDVFNAGLGYALARAWLAFTRAPIDAGASPHADVHPAVRKAAWLLRDESAELSNAQLSERVGLSPHRLSRLFKREMGTTLVEFRNRQRIERVLDALGKPERVLDALGKPDRLGAFTELNLTRLAYEVGFGSYTQFHRVFREQVGSSPREYLRRR